MNMQQIRLHHKNGHISSWIPIHSATNQEELREFMNKAAGSITERVLDQGTIYETRTIEE